MIKFKLLAILTIGLLSQISLAQDFDRSKLDSYFDALDSHNRFMGSVAISQNGKIIYTKSVGFSDVENNTKATDISKYRIGSISKTFTTVLVLKGVEKGLIDLQQTVDKYFPTIENATMMTIQHLLTHRSGLYNFTNDEEYLDWNTQAKTEEEMVYIIGMSGSDFEPGTQAAYSNSNFVLLTYILQKVYNKSYADLVAEHITIPLGLNNTYFGGSINPKKNECKSYRFTENWVLSEETDLSIPLGAGGMISTASDLVKFSDGLFTGNLLTKASLDKMKTLEDNFGMGLFQVPFFDRIGFGHGGGIDGFSSIFSYFSDGGVSYALVSNGTNYNTNDISIAVLSAVYGKTYSLPTFYQVSSEDIDNYVGMYASDQVPLKINIFYENSTLKAQATGQPALSLEATEKHKFKFDTAGIEMEFKPTDNSMILKQGGGIYTFQKE